MEKLDKFPPLIMVVPEEISFVKDPTVTPAASTVREEAEFILAFAPLEKAVAVEPFSQFVAT